MEPAPVPTQAHVEPRPTVDAEELRRFRDGHAYTQQQMADALHMHVGQYNRIERGWIEHPQRRTIAYIRALIDGCGCERCPKRRSKKAGT